MKWKWINREEVNVPIIIFGTMTTIMVGLVHHPDESIGIILRRLLVIIFATILYFVLGDIEKTKNYSWSVTLLAMIFSVIGVIFGY